MFSVCVCVHMCKGKNLYMNSKKRTSQLAFDSVWNAQTPKDLLKEHYEEKKATKRG